MEKLINDMEKKGEITTSSLVGIVLLVAGVAIILFFYFQLNFFNQVDQTVCKESVILRATTNEVPGVSNIIPLKCKTEKVCVTSGLIGGDCKENFGNQKVTKAKVSNVEQVEKLIVNEVFDCWSMMGEGKVSVFSNGLASSYGLGDVYSSCVICSRIAFDTENLKFDPSGADPLKYMITHKIPNKDISYYNYFAGEGSNIQISDEIKIPNLQFDNDGKIIGVKDGDGGTVSTEPGEVTQSDELAVLFMQVSAPSQKDVWFNIGRTVGGASLFSFATSPPATIALGGKALGACRALPHVCAAIGLVGASMVTYNVEKNKGVAAGRCGDIAIGSEARNGCSVVRVVNYDVKDISQYCGVIESIS